MKSPLVVRELTELEFDQWDTFVARAPEGSIHYTSRYLAALCEASGGRFRVLAAHQGNELRGGVALYEESSRWGTVVAPRLLLYYNGIVLRSYDTQYPSQQTSRDLETQTALEAGLRARGYARLCLKSRSPLRDVRVFQGAGWTVIPTYTYVVPLTDRAGLWGRCDQNLRRLVGRCENQGITFSEDDDFESFFRMHLDVHHRKAAPLYLPKPQFERYVGRLMAEGLCRLYHARLPSGRSIAAQLVLVGAHPVSHTVCAATDGEFLSLGASAFLRWRAFEALAGLGSVANDLTDAALNPVTRFKSQLGADLQVCLQIARTDRLGIRLRDGLQGARRAVAIAARRIAGASYTPRTS